MKTRDLISYIITAVSESALCLLANTNTVSSNNIIIAIEIQKELKETRRDLVNHIKVSFASTEAASLSRMHLPEFFECDFHSVLSLRIYSRVI